MLLRLLYPFAKIFWRIFPRVDLGTRVMVVHEGRVLLVKMTYLKNWYFPGGGVDQHESLPAGAARELLEETGYRATSLRFVSMYFDSREKASNHIAFFICESASQVEGAVPDREISHVEWFPLNALPDGISPATGRRVDEYLAGRTPSETW